jgi:hypothetical protein
MTEQLSTPEVYTLVGAHRISQSTSLQCLLVTEAIANTQEVDFASMYK